MCDPCRNELLQEPLFMLNGEGSISTFILFDIWQFHATRFFTVCIGCVHCFFVTGNPDPKCPCGDESTQILIENMSFSPLCVIVETGPNELAPPTRVLF